MPAVHATLSARVPVELAQQFVAHAERQDRSLSAELRIAMREHLGHGNSEAQGGHPGLRESGAGAAGDVSAG